jgi:hypothetical protein
LILVVGCLLLGWELLDQQGKNATIMEQWLYAGPAWVAYISLFEIALYHREGIAGFALRLTLGVVLIYASADEGLLAGQADAGPHSVGFPVAAWNVTGAGRGIRQPTVNATPPGPSSATALQAPATACTHFPSITEL